MNDPLEVSLFLLSQFTGTGNAISVTQVLNGSNGSHPVWDGPAVQEATDAVASAAKPVADLTRKLNGLSAQVTEKLKLQ